MASAKTHGVDFGAVYVGADAIRVDQLEDKSSGNLIFQMPNAQGTSGDLLFLNASTTQIGFISQVNLQKHTIGIPNAFTTNDETLFTTYETTIDWDEMPQNNVILTFNMSVFTVTGDADIDVTINAGAQSAVSAITATGIAQVNLAISPDLAGNQLVSVTIQGQANTGTFTTATIEDMSILFK